MAQLINSPLEITFTDPQFLYLIILIPLLIIIYFGSMSYKKRRAINFPNFEALERTGLTEIHSKNIFYLYIFISVILLVILSVSGMTLSLVANTSKFSYVIAIDNSESMRATDLTPNRLELSKEAAKDFINNLPLGVKVGIVSFSGSVEILLSPDNTKTTIINAIDQIDFSQTSGTNLNDAIIAGNELLNKEKMKSMIILSDGQINIGNISDTIDYSQENDLIINTIALGTAEGGDTSLGFTSKTDLEILKSLAFNTKGKFFSIAESDDKEIPFNEILENSNGRIELNISKELLIIALVLLIIFWISYNFRFKNFP